MNLDEAKVGMLVQLVSGSPPMTVVQINEKTIVVHWFERPMVGFLQDSSWVRQTAFYDPMCLKEVTK